MTSARTLSLTFLLRRILLASLLVLPAGFAGCDKPAPPPPPPAEVTTVTLAPQTVPVNVEFVAQVESSHQVEILARVSGFLDKILYREGEMVKAGQVMFQIDPKPFQAAVAAAKGEVENRQAQLWTAKANLDRVKPLAALDAISKSDLDNATGEVQAAEAALYSAKANLDKAQLDLGYTTIHAPVGGVAGEAFFREGTYLTAGATGRLSYVAQIDPIWVTFSVSQNQMMQRQQEIAAGQLIRPDNLQLPDRSGTLRRQPLPLCRQAELHLADLQPGDRHLPAPRRTAQRQRRTAPGDVRQGERQGRYPPQCPGGAAEGRAAD